MLTRLSLLEQCAQELRYAVRGLGRNRLFTLSAIAMLTLGITAVTVVFSIVDAVLLRPSSFIDPPSVTQIEQWRDDRGWGPISPSVYMRLLRERRDLFTEVIAKRRGALTVTRVPVPDQMFGELVTGNLFSLLAAKPIYGRKLAPGDDPAGAPAVMLLSYHAWQQLFLSDPQVIGKIAEVDGRATAIIGVMPEGFVMPGRSADIWLPLRLSGADMADEHAAWVETLARLKPGITLKTAQAALNHEKMRLRISIWQAENKPTRDLILWLAMGAVMGLLAIGCANVSSLLMARGLSRRREYAIRIATGASHGRLVRQSFLEAMLLSFLGLAFALACSKGIIEFLRESLNATALGIVDIGHARIDFRLVIFSFAASTLAALLSAGLPAWIAASADPFEGLRESGTQMASGHRVRRLMFALTGAQGGICMALLLVSGLLVRSLVRLTNDDHGMRTDHVLTMRLPYGTWFPAARTAEERLKQTRRYLSLLSRVQSVNGVQAAALSSSLPLSNVTVSTHLQQPSETARADSPLMLVRTVAVTKDYFRVMGISLEAGQLFRPSDGPGQPKVAIVNQAFADRYFRGVNPIGRFLQGESGSEPEQIIGVIRNTVQLDLKQAPEPELFVSFEQTLLTPFLTGLVVRSGGAPESLAAALRTVISQEDPRQPVVKVRTLRSLVRENIALSRASAWILSAFALVALALWSAGIYGVVSFATLARRRDFGIRLCLGATRAGIFKMATWQALRPVWIGMLGGVAAAWFCGRAVSAVLYKASTFDIVPAAISLTVLVMVSFAAAAIPALRSAWIDPARTMRDE
jgi:putative ABC transport system permease protein